MASQVALRVLTRPGDDVLVGTEAVLQTVVTPVVTFRAIWRN